MLKNMLDPEGSSCDKPDYSYVSSQVDAKRSSENDQALVDDITYKKMLGKNVEISFHYFSIKEGKRRHTS